GRRSCQARVQRKSGQKSAHILVAVGVGRSAPSQPLPGLADVPSAAYPLSLSAEGDPAHADGASSWVLLTSQGRRGVTLNHLCGIVAEANVAMKKYPTDAAIQLDDGRHGESPSGELSGSSVQVVTSTAWARPTFRSTTL